MENKIRQIQKDLVDNHLDGWLFYDFRRTNDLACNFLKIPLHQLLTRRFFYWIPAIGEPKKIVHMIENPLFHLPGKTLSYDTWQNLENCLATILKGNEIIAMEYSPRNAIPTVSKVDAGTMEVVRQFGVKVVSSCNLLQKYNSVLNEEQLNSHLEAEAFLSETVKKAWCYISGALRDNQAISEYDVQQFIKKEFEKHNYLSEGDPICAVNAHSADPHYTPSKQKSLVIQKGDFILIDLWAKQKLPHAIYADITRVGVAAEKPTEIENKIFNIVKEAQQAALDLIIQRFSIDKKITGWEVDKACRTVIEEAGYGKYFIHRTGHNIDTRDHGSGANIDNYETKDDRILLPATCFSIEPGIYLPNQFGVRLEYDVYIHKDGKIQVTGGKQEEIVCLLKPDCTPKS